MSSANIKKSLKDSNLALAFIALKKRLDTIGNYDLISAYEEAHNTYNAMLTYMLQGYMDTESTARRDELIRTLFSINDQADRLERIKELNRASRYISTETRMRNASFVNIVQRLEVELDEDEHETELCNLFDYIWTCGAWKKSDYDTANVLLSSPNIKTNDKAVFISAVTLALIEMFDVRKLHLLFDAYLSESGIINQRALVGLVIVIRLYDSRLKCFPEIQARINIYADDPHFVSEMFSVMTMFQYSTITEQVSNIMRNDFWPLMMQKQKEMNKLSPKELEDEFTRNGENPEWLNDSKVRKKLAALTDMQRDGADLYMSSFRYMKGYPFFNAIPHWFYPFDPHSQFIKDKNGDYIYSKFPIIKVMINNSAFCSSDLYSFCMMLNSISNVEANFFSSQISEQISDEEMNTIMEDSFKKDIPNKDIRRAYIFDLYRFYICLPYNRQFYNPFMETRKNADGTDRKIPFSPLETEAFHFMLSHREEMIDMAEFFMRKGFYEAALEMYHVINPQQVEEDANIWQKIGFCKQKLGKEKSAYKTYLLADSLLPNSRWTMTHIAQLAMKLEIYDTALSFYDLLLMQDDENMKYLVNKATCEMKLEQYDDAITTLYKADYIDENNASVNEMMVECYLHVGQMQKAMDLLHKLIANADCPLELKIICSLLWYKNISAERAMELLRDTLYIYNSGDERQPFPTLFNKVSEKYCDLIGIERSNANMLLDAGLMDII